MLEVVASASAPAAAPADDAAVGSAGAGATVAGGAGAVAVDPPPQAVSSPAAATPPTPVTTARLLRGPGATGCGSGWVADGWWVVCGHEVPRVVGAFTVGHGSLAGMVHRRAWVNLVVR